ncbi:MAG: hypothetical protein KDD94_12755, partial [Calditrichaeota bacterium]|nr:hypothetical protein [Calditrichota bacterium]
MPVLFRLLVYCVILQSIISQPLRVVENAIDDEFIVRHWTIDNGLPQNTINGIAQDSAGFIWIATYGGLVRFDGIRFKPVSIATSDYMLSNRVVSIFIDSRQNRWIGYQDIGITRVSPKGTITHWQNEAGTVRGFAEAAGGTIWAAGSEGLVRIADDSLRIYRHMINGRNYEILSVKIGPANRPWFTVNNTLARIEDDSIRIIKTTKYNASSVYVNPDSSYWLSGIELLERYDQNGRKQSYRYGDRYYDFARDKKSGDLWISTHDYIVRQTDNRLIRYRLTGNSSSLRTGRIFFDKENNLWIGSDGNGIYQLKHKAFRQLLSGYNFVSILSDQQGNIYTKSSCGDLLLINDKGIQRYDLDLGCFPFIALDQKESLWFSNDYGIFNWQGPGRLKQTYQDFDTEKSHSTHFAHYFYQDSEGFFWIGVPYHGLLKFDGKNVIANYREADGLLSDKILFITEDSKQRLWIGTETGASIFESGRFTNLSAKDGLSRTQIRVIYEDSDQVIWLGSYGDGISRIENGEIRKFTETDGLAENVVSRLIEDKQENLWLVGNKSISYINRDQFRDYAAGKIDYLQPVVFAADEGVIENNGNGLPATDKEGVTWFPTINGLIGININEYQPDSIAPIVEIEQLLFNDSAQSVQSETIEFEAAERRNIELYYTAA